jgi:outer membrane protein OmpA-like peptidoglycan-associated protein
MCRWASEDLTAMPKRAAQAFLLCASVVVAVSLRPAAEAQKYKPDDPVPPGAKGQVTTLQGQVTNLVGLSLAVGGKVDSLNATLKDLGARTTDTEIQIDLASDLMFDFDKADLRPTAIPSLQKVVTVMRAYPAYPCTIGGHTDGKGDKAYNQKLSERRADSVKTWLVAHGASNPITARGFGDTKPIAPNKKPDGSDDPEGRQKNRRVEITLHKS